MSIQLRISPRIIPSIASLYNDTNRILMEYIDNSIDSAEEFFNEKENSYNKKITIVVAMKDDEIEVLDNCFGITNFEKIIQEIGNSDKKAQPWTNGQFGYGIYSFLAGCDELTIISKVITEDKAKKISIDKDKFDNDYQEQVVFPDIEYTEFPFYSGTKVVLSDFDKDMWKSLDFDEIKEEIEKHFELLLARKNLEIKLVDNRVHKEYICKPFDYEKYEGEVYKDKLQRLSYTKGRMKPETVNLIVPNPIQIFLKVTKGRTINKPPVFIATGRRIAEVKEIKSFRSKHKSDIWGHPNMTGYIDLSNYLDPTIARNDFRNNEKSRALFNTLETLEPLILEVIREVNKETEEEHYKHLEDKLNQALSKLAKIDAMNFRTQFLSGKDINLEPGGSKQTLEEGFGGKDRGDQSNETDTGGDFGENEGKGFGGSGNPGNDIPGGKEEGEDATNKEAENPFKDSSLKGKERRKSGFDIKFVDGLIVNDQTKEPHRSQLIGGQIRIFKEHPSFKERVNYTRTGEPKISQRLLTYLAGEITVHYKDKLQTRYGQPEYNKQLFENLVEFIYDLEELIKDLAGQNLSDYE